MHAQYRARKNPKAFVSSYCPLDLYSGQDSRIAKAMGALWDMWAESAGTSNNLRMFADGKIVLPADVRLNKTGCTSISSQ